MKYIKKRDDINEQAGIRLVKIVITKNDINAGMFDNWEDLPKKIKDDVSCSNRGLTSLKGGPTHIDGDFDCSDNKLKNLVGGPFVGKNYYCSRNKLTSLRGSPKKTIKDFMCHTNNLKNLKNGPTTADTYDCSANKLESLEGAPTEVFGSFICHSNNLKSLIGGPIKIHHDLDCGTNPLESLEGLPDSLNGIWTPDHIELEFKDLYSFDGKLRSEEEFELLIKEKPKMAKYIVGLCSKKFRDKYEKTIKGIDQFDFFGED